MMNLESEYKKSQFSIEDIGKIQRTRDSAKVLH